MPEDYATYRIMRLFHMTHPDQVDDLPMGFADWALQFHRVEEEVRKEVEKRAMDEAKSST